MHPIRPYRFTAFYIDAVLGVLVVVSAIYFLLRAFRRNRKGGDGRPRDDWPPRF